MVESKLVELVVAGSNPVGHPMFTFPGGDQFNFGLETALTPALPLNLNFNGT
jgi:hypothetical protein